MDGCTHTKPVKFLIESVNPIQRSLNGTFNKQVSDKAKCMHLLSNIPKVTSLGVLNFILKVFYKMKEM